MSQPSLPPPSDRTGGPAIEIPASHQDALQLFGPRFAAEPAEVYREMRRTYGPVVPTLLPGDVPAWLVIGYRELLRVTENTKVFGHDTAHWRLWPHLPQDWPIRPLVQDTGALIWREGEEHRRRSEAIAGALEGIDLNEIQEATQQFAQGLIEKLGGSDGRADLIAGYAHALPALVLSRLLGMSDAESVALVESINAVVDAGADAARGLLEIRQATKRLVERKRERPGHDVTSRILAHPAGITDGEAAEDLMLLVLVGHQPSANWIGMTLWLMLTDQEYAADMGGGRRSIRQAMHQVLRDHTPVQILAGRFTTQDTVLGTARIPAGDLILLGFAGANTDPYIRPEHSRPEGHNAYMSYSNGEYRCPYAGQWTAEVVAHTAVETLLEHLPDVTLAVPPDELQWSPSPFARGLEALPVSFTPAHAFSMGPDWD